MLQLRMASRRVREQQTDRESMLRSNGTNGNTVWLCSEETCVHQRLCLKDRLGGVISDH